MTTVVSNAAFLGQIFTGLQSDEYLWTTAFVTSPNEAGPSDWSGKRLSRPDDCPDTAHGNSYFSVASLKASKGGYRRRKENFSRLYCVVLDDAGECDLAPTWRLRTSADKVQVGFKLREPLDDLEVAIRIHEMLGAGGLIPADKNGNNPVRYVRLPVGKNTKYSPHFEGYLELFNPEVTHQIGDLIQALGLDLEYIIHGRRKSGDTSNIQFDAERTPDDELIHSIMSGESFHDPLLKLTARYAQQGMDERAIVNVVKGLMLASNEKGSDRWLNRFNDIERTVRGGVAKFSPPKHAAMNYRLLSAEEVAALPPLAWRIKRVLPATGLAAIYGPSGSGKSFLTLDMLASIAGGRDWQGYRCHQAPVVYVCMEGEGGLSQRIQAYKCRNGGGSTNGMYFLTAPFRLLEDTDVERLAQVILDAGGHGAVVCLDTLNQATPGADENSSEDMGRAIAAAKKLQLALGGLVVLVHHSGKDLQRGMRGHSSLFAALDAVIEVARNGDLRSWKATKSKDGADGAEHGFKLEVVNLGLDDDLDTIDSCVVVAEAQTGQKKKRLSPSLEYALKTLIDTCQEYGTEYPDADVGGVAAHLEDWRQQFYKSSTAETQEAKRKAFERARKDLVNLGVVTVSEDVYRPSDIGVQASLRLLVC